MHAYEPQMIVYNKRAIDPSQTPSYVVPGDLQYILLTKLRKTVINKSKVRKYVPKLYRIQDEPHKILHNELSQKKVNLIHMHNSRQILLY